MFGADHYVPILKGRAGEFAALRTLRPPQRAALTPLIEIPPIPTDPDTGAPKYTIDEHLAKIGLTLQKACGSRSPIFVDALHVDGLSMADGHHPLRYILDDARPHKVKIIPVTGPGRSATYDAAVTSGITTDRLGVAVRPHGEDLSDPAILDTALLRLLKRVGGTLAEADLIVDFADQVPLKIAVEALLSGLPSLARWRTVTVASAGFPIDLSAYTSGSHFIDRRDWRLWLGLHASTRLSRIPTFGDYAVAHPAFRDFNFKTMQVSAQIRCTCDDKWLVLKGRSTKVHGFAQFPRLCKTLVGRPEFCGAAFSWGDDYIAQCAKGTVGTGNHTTWRQVGTNHHLAKVVHQIGALAPPRPPAPSVRK